MAGGGLRRGRAAVRASAAACAALLAARVGATTPPSASPMSPTESPFTDPTLSPQAPSASPTASPSSTPSATPSASPSAAPSWGPAPASHFEFMTESQLNSQIDRWIAEDGVADYSDRCPGIFRPLSGSLLRCNRGGSVRCCVSILAEQHTKFECKVHGYLCNPGVFTDCLGVPGGGPVRSYIVQSANLSQPRVSQVKCEKEKLTPEVVILDFTVSNPPDTVLECLPKIDGAGKFYELLEKAGLFRADQLSGMTLFAFADHAYEALTSGVRGMLELKPTENSSDSSVLRLLRAHVAHGQSFIQQSGSAVTLTPRPGAPVPDPHCDSSRCPMRDGSEVLVEGQQGTAVVTPQCATPNCGANSAVVAERNIACSDSVVHLISSTLATPAMGLPTKTISDVLSERNSSFLSVAAAVMSKLLPVDGPEALTCFVPTNVAMDSSLRNTSSAFHSADWRPVLTTNLTHNSLGSGLPILTDENISRVLVFHCSRGYVWLPKWGANDTTPIDPLGPCTDPDCSTANTTEKVFVSFVHPDSPTFDGLGPGEERSGVLVGPRGLETRVVERNIACSNGIFHFVDGVMFPADVRPSLLADSAKQTLPPSTAGSDSGTNPLLYILIGGGSVLGVGLVVWFVLLRVRRSDADEMSIQTYEQWLHKELEERS